ncbi:conserved oligomeric golgi complex component 4 [Fusarium pseudocircinatum]|uniref:Conserved oligomeric golgi complex component 4 n=1 Tax=Fusarium pseudocircinatum TaxID=56676 RepID=A0A8H5UTU2_9HYPO|nr:conserved oligomeric golgi complex component 4 [Fusarium pseudocircinatum]
MTPRTYAALTSLAAKKLARVLKKCTWSSSDRVTALGGLRLESDFSGTMSVIAKDSHALREPFTRLQEILAIANMKDDERNELGSGYDSSKQGRSRFLSDEEMAKALSSYNIIVPKSMGVDKDFRALAKFDQGSRVGLVGIRFCRQSNEMAAPEPEATPATAVEVAEEDDAMILSDDTVNLATQLATKVIELQQTAIRLQETLETVIEQQETANQQQKLINEQQETVNEQQETVNEQHKTIQQLVEHRQQDLTGHNQGASQIDEDDDETEN